ncbi:MAG: hypothetical protein ABJG68_05550 [Crocinitomicaceae bacterium]
MNKLLLIFCLIFASFSYGQYDMEEAASDTTKKEPKVNPRTLTERIYVGGDLSLRFGQLIYIYVAPMAGIDIYKGISAGLSPMYQLYRFNQLNGGSVSSHSYGCSLFGRYRPINFPPLLVQTEFALYNVEDLSTSNFTDRTTVPAFMAGLGYAGSLGEKNYYQFMLKYDFINNPSNPLPKFFFNLPLYISYGMVFYLG